MDEKLLRVRFKLLGFQHVFMCAVCPWPKFSYLNVVIAEITIIVVINNNLVWLMFWEQLNNNSEKCGVKS